MLTVVKQPGRAGVGAEALPFDPMLVELPDGVRQWLRIPRFDDDSAIVFAGDLGHFAVRFDSSDEGVLSAIHRHKASIADEVLAVDFRQEEASSEVAELNGRPIRYSIVKA